MGGTIRPLPKPRCVPEARQGCYVVMLGAYVLGRVWKSGTGRKRDAWACSGSPEPDIIVAYFRASTRGACVDYLFQRWLDDVRRVREAIEGGP